MRVEIWSDVACPWCYVGTRRFERAVAETGVPVEVTYRAFELDPSLPPGEPGPPLVEYLARKFGDATRVRAAHARLDEAGEELGIDFRWEGMRRTSTFDAHRLLTWALATSSATAQRALKAALLRAHFTDGLDVADHEVLADLAHSVGLDRHAALEVLASDAHADEVRAERRDAHASGIAAVPTFVVEGEWMLQGALDTDQWVKALTHIDRELHERSARA